MANYTILTPEQAAEQMGGRASSWREPAEVFVNQVPVQGAISFEFDSQTELERARRGIKGAIGAMGLMNSREFVETKTAVTEEGQSVLILRKVQELLTDTQYVAQQETTTDES